MTIKIINAMLTDGHPAPKIEMMRFHSQSLGLWLTEKLTPMG